MFISVNESQQYIWTHIEPNCSIIAACLPTYGPLFKGHSADSFIAGLRSFFSVSSWSTGPRGSGKGSGKDGGKDSERLTLQGQRLKRDTAWQKLEHGKNTTVEIAGGKKMDDDKLESRELSQMELGVTKGYGSQSRLFEER